MSTKPVISIGADHGGYALAAFLATELSGSYTILSHGQAEFGPKAEHVPSTFID